MWLQLEDIGNGINDPWLIMGDYNAILHSDDRAHDTAFQEAEIRDFKYFMANVGLCELKSVGRNYTWTNGHVFSKIDKVIVKSSWITTMNDLEDGVLDSGCSDHSPLMLHFAEKTIVRSRPFKTDHSQIKKLKLPDGSWTKADNEVQHEIIKFYLLLRTTANHLPTIDPIVCTTGNVLNRSQQMKLIQPMKPEEVTNALIGIEDMKALSVECFNRFFYKKSWTVIGEDVTKILGEGNTKSGYNQFMNHVMKPFIGKFVMVYFDDVLVYSKSIEERVLYLQNIFEVLRKKKLYGNLEKCSFGMNEVVFLGFVLRSRGVEVDESKIGAIKNKPTPKSIGEVRIFHRLASFYR
ncbi:hypothetical protein T459_26147 [Capsicum annuum]|uniref:Uncharacterized protein n=1 Tax=Capsicum annuum TaxID=4072 RepID=A0A2G2YMQ4_CAPAN|nr:hypothetical protein T459_26147 [Capsicum annuum]